MAVVTFAAAPAATAAVIFTDDFSGDSAGTGYVVYSSSLANWNITQGNVDAVLNGSYGCAASSGNCIDLDGTGSPAAARLETIASFSFVAGEQYTILFSVPSLNGGANDNYHVSIGTLYDSGTLSGIQNIAAPFTVGSSQTATIVIEVLTPTNNAGPFLDFVTLNLDASAPPPPPVANVSEPASLAVFGLGLAGLGFMRRRRAA